MKTVVETAICKISSKLTVKGHQNDVNGKVFEDISNIALVFPYFEPVKVSWNIFITIAPSSFESRFVSHSSSLEIVCNPAYFFGTH